MKYYIEAMPKVLENNPKAKFYIIGDGEDKLRTTAFGEKNWELSLVFMGYRKDVRNLMCQLDLVVLSSLMGGLPLTPIEAIFGRKNLRCH